MSEDVEPKLVNPRASSLPGAAARPAAHRYHLIWRAAAATALVMALYLWWTHNYGKGLTAFPVVAALSAAFSVAMEVLDESYKSSIKRWFAKTLLSPALLVPGYIGVFVLLSSRAPLVVLNEESDSLGVTLFPAEHASGQELVGTAQKDNPARFHVWSSPLGRPFVLKVQGYAPKTIDVAAPMGATISPERDLIPQVTLLLRPTADGMIELLSGGSLHVYRQEVNRETEIANTTPHARSSFLIGVTPVTVPHDLLEDWRLQLAGQKMTDVARANLLLSWKSPQFVKLLSPSDELTAHQRLKVVLRTAGNQITECGAVDLPEGAGAIADLALHSCTENEP